MTFKKFHRGFLVAGHIAKDIHIKIDDSNSLPKKFKKLFKDSTPISMVSNVLGKKGSFKDVLNVIERNAIEPSSYSYGGRGPNVAYGAALLGAKIELIGFVGEDFDKQYPGFFNGGYKTHLKKAGVKVNELAIEPNEMHSIKEEKHEHGILAIKTREIPSIYCVKDSHGTDFYLIDDLKGAHVHATDSPTPKQLINRYDGIFVTSGEPSFNRRLIDYAFQQGKEVLFDVAAYETTSQYLKEVIPKCNTILGNTYEIGLVMKALHLNDIHQLFRISPNVSKTIVEDKIACTIKIYQKERQTPVEIGPINVDKRVSSVGCCDGIAAGYLALYSQGYDVITAAKAGLIQCASIWQVEGVQEGMLNKQQLFQRLEEDFILVKG